MVSKIAMINLLLALLSGFFLFKTIQVWQTDPILSSNQGEVAPSDEHRQTKNTNTGQAFLVKKGTAPKSAFGDIADKNLFSLDRTQYQPVEIKEETLSTETPKVDGRKITLFGVILLDGYRSALVSNPEVKSGEASTRWVKLGDRIARMNVEQISKDSIVSLWRREKISRLTFICRKISNAVVSAAVSPAAETDGRHDPASAQSATQDR